MFQLTFSFLVKSGQKLCLDYVGNLFLRFLPFFPCKFADFSLESFCWPSPSFGILWLLPLILFTSVQDNWECPHLEICSYGSVQSIVNCIVKQSSSGTYGVSSDITIPLVNLFIRFQSLLEFIVFAKHEMIKVPNLVQSAQLPRFSCYIELTVVDPLQKITDTRDGVSDQT